MLTEQSSAVYSEPSPLLVPSAKFRRRFELQAIINTSDLRLYGYEFLYRGKIRPTSSAGWRTIDQSLLNHLGIEGSEPGSVSFVNLSHESLLAIPDRVFILAAETSDVRFEVSEERADDEVFARVCEKVNRLSALGLQFVLDDFGAGIDGCRRLYSLDRVSAVKIDRDLLVSASLRPAAAGMLRASVAHWNETGIITVAEGVETPQLMEFALRTGFRLVQGYHVDTLAARLNAHI